MERGVRMVWSELRGGNEGKNEKREHHENGRAFGCADRNDVFHFS